MGCGAALQERMWGLVGQHVGHEPAVRPGSKEAKSIPGHTIGSIASRPKKVIIYFWSATCGIVCPVLAPKMEGKSQQTETSSVEATKWSRGRCSTCPVKESLR